MTPERKDQFAERAMTLLVIAVLVAAILLTP